MTDWPERARVVLGQPVEDPGGGGTHHTIVVSDCVVFSRDNKVYLRLTLPDNPDCKSAPFGLKEAAVRGPVLTGNEPTGTAIRAHSVPEESMMART